MKLFFSPGATSLAVRIVLLELGIDADYLRVDLESEIVPATGQAYGEIHPMGKVPALQLDDGSILSEGAAVLQYLADREPGRGLAPAAGTMARYRLMEVLNFLASEIHKGYASMFDPEVPPAYRERLMQDTRALRRLAELLSNGPYMLGERFTVADAYAYSLLRLAMHAGMDFTPFSPIARFFERVASRPSVVAANRAEGLIGGCATSGNDCPAESTVAIAAAAWIPERSPSTLR